MYYILIDQKWYVRTPSTQRLTDNPCSPKINEALTKHLKTILETINP